MQKQKTRSSALVYVPVLLVCVYIMMGTVIYKRYLLRSCLTYIVANTPCLLRNYFFFNFQTLSRHGHGDDARSKSVLIAPQRFGRRCKLTEMHHCECCGNLPLMATLSRKSSGRKISSHAVVTVSLAKEQVCTVLVEASYAWNSIEEN